MGYTNYWDQSTNFTDKEWKQIKDEFNYVRYIAGDKIDVTADNDKNIVFNGIPGCETFKLNKIIPTKQEYAGQDLKFNFCKTRELPYDIYVWHMLVFIMGLKRTNEKKDFKISRDR